MPVAAARRAVQTARRIQEDILGDGSPAGTLFGSQRCLRRRYDIGDDTLGAAVRILEFNGIARMRSGRGGGLVVCRPPLELVVASIVGHLLDRRGGERDRGRSVQVRQARASLTVALARLLTSANGEAGSAERLATRLDTSGEISPGEPAFILADVLGDACLHLAAHTLHGLAVVLQGDLGTLPPPRTTAAGDIADELKAFVGSCRLDGATDRALKLVGGRGRQPAGDDRLADPFLSYRSPLNRSRVGQVVRTIAFEMKAGMLARHLGSEETLGERYKVSRSTIRQALCVLEDAEIVTARRGRHNGWFACAEPSALPFRQVRNYLRSRAVQPATARRSAEAWRSAAVEPNPVTDFLLRTFEAYAGFVDPCASSDSSCGAGLDHRSDAPAPLEG